MENAVYFNRDLSWIDFNERILGEGLRQDLLPLDRLKFLAIVASNFDEFFMVRVATMKQAIRSGSTGNDPSGLDPAKQLKMGSERVRSIFKRQYACLEREVFPSLAKEGLELVHPDSYSIHHIDFLETLFTQKIYPVLTPLKIEEDKPLPFIENASLHVVFLLSDENGKEHISVVQMPSILDRIIWLPKEHETSKTRYTLLEDVITTWGEYLYHGFQVQERMTFKINRDADFSVDEKRDEDFVSAMEEVLENREKSIVIRMICSAGSEKLRDTMAERFDLDDEDIYEVNGPMNLMGLLDISDKSGFEHLRESAWKIYDNPAFNEEQSIWESISQGDILLHLPYQAFDPVINYFQTAASDPDVIAIKTALYRTSGNSPIIKALEQAALSGKHVTALVELKARFDEERNISWANRLEKAGVIVIYGLAHLKVHAKVSVVVRREGNHIKRYVHMATGNYNDKTAKLYEDMGLFTAREDIAFDVGLLFNMITGYSVIQSMRKLVIAPTSLKRKLLSLIEQEIMRSSEEYPGKIIAKMNSLADIDVINALYRASQAGVSIYLNVRGICMLVPGVPGLSENIHVMSIIDRYLEHSRIFYFNNGGAGDLFLASADWMPRNLERRVELMFPILQENVKKDVYAILEAYFRDNSQSWSLSSDGSWKRQKAQNGEKPFRIQTYMLSRAKEASERSLSAKEEFIVRRRPTMGT